MKYLIRIVLSCGIFLSFSSFGQNNPTVGTVTSNIINRGTGDNYIIVGNVTDGDASVVQSIAVSATSTNNAVLSVTGVSYTTGQSFAIIKVREFGLNGTATINFSATDADGITNRSFNINVGTYYVQGSKFSIYDILFWQRTTPKESDSKKDYILPFAESPTDQTLWDGIGMTVGVGHGAWGSTDNATFYTTGYRGVMLPSLTGVYMFTMNYQDAGSLTIFDANDSPNIKGGFSTGPYTARSITDTVYLRAGEPYRYLAYNWVVFTEAFAIQWAYLGTSPTNVTTVTSKEMPINGTDFLTNPTDVGGTSINYLIPGFVATGNTRNRTAGAVAFNVLGNAPGLATYPYYDVVKPVSISGLALLRKSNNRLEFSWNKATNDVELSSYRIYVNGVLSYTTPNAKQISYVVTSLTSGITYSVFITAVDKAGNESDISNVLQETTFAIDNTPPTPPTSLIVNVLGDMSASVSWSGATDNATGIFGYKIYVDGVLYNKDTTINTSIILKTYQPQTVHSFQVMALDGNLNPSTLSASVSFTTLGFNALIAAPGIKKVQMNVTKEYIGKIDGIGLNAGYNVSTFTAPYSNRIRDLNPGLLRWGTLDANPLTYAQSSVGNRTYAKFINYCNSLNAAADICIGSDGNPIVEWRDETLVAVPGSASITRMQYTVNQFMHYLYAPDSIATKSIAGADFNPYHTEVKKRLNEGFSQANLTGDAFSGLIIEFGNEVWGGTCNTTGCIDHNSDGFNDYITYGIWCRKLAKMFKSHPLFDSTKVKLTYSGREPQLAHSYNLHNNLYFPNPADNFAPDYGDLLSPGGYLGGNLTYVPGVEASSSELGYYQNGMQYMYKNLNGLYETNDMIINQRNKQVGYFMYESAMTTETYTQRIGQAIVLTDYHLSSHKAGAYYPGLFSFEGGIWGISLSDGTLLPMFKSAQLINNVTKGKKDILKVNYSSLENVKNEVGEVLSATGRAALEPVSMNVYHKKGTYSIVLISRNFEEDFQVQLNFPSGMLLTPTVSGAARYDFATSGDYSSKLSTVSSSIVSITDKMIITVPKYAMVVLTFGGEALASNFQQLGFSPYRRPSGFSLVVDNPSNPGNLLMSEAYGNIFLNASVTGGITSMSTVGWNVYKQDSVTSLNISILEGNSLKINATDCRSNGVVTVTAYSIANPNLRDSFVITITGQFNEGLTSQEACPKFNLTDSIPNTIAKSKPNFDFKIFPNPSSGVLNITTNLFGDFRLYNLQGTLVYSKYISSKNESFYTNIEPGLYFATFTNGTGTITKKIVITK